MLKVALLRRNNTPKRAITYYIYLIYIYTYLVTPRKGYEMDAMKCSNCQWWKVLTIEECEEQGVVQSPYLGYCLRNAPSPVVHYGCCTDRIYSPVWPITSENDYCGEGHYRNEE